MSGVIFLMIAIAFLLAAFLFVVATLSAPPRVRRLTSRVSYGSCVAALISPRNVGPVPWKSANFPRLSVPMGTVQPQQAARAPSLANSLAAALQGHVDINDVTFYHEWPTHGVVGIFA
jgi:hypothetical protein